MKSIFIESIEHKNQRYDTVGDWYETILGAREPKTPIVKINVAKMSDAQYEILVAIHELVEKVLCDQAGITEKMVDEFDMNWKEHNNIDEPGNDTRAPYHKQHKIADVIERLLAIELGVDWEKYNKEVNSL